MNRVEWLAKKSKAIVRKGPATLRNIFYSKLGIWPVGRIDHSDLQDVSTYCISLVRATQKRKLILGQAAGMGLSKFQILDAVDARALSIEGLMTDGRYDDAAARQYHPNGLTLNEIACSLSHGLAYATIVANGDPVALILEDDALFVTRRIKRFRFSELPADFDVILLNTFRTTDPPAGHLGGMYYDVTSYNGSAAAYLVSQKGAQKLQRAGLPVVHAADGLLGRCMELTPGATHPFKQHGAPTTLKCYMVYPDCVLNGSTSYYHMSEVQPRSNYKSQER